MRKKYTEQDYIDKCNDFNVIYIGNHKENHRGTMIDFICKKHKEKGVQSIDWSHFKDKKQACPYCFGKRNTNDAQKLIKNKDIEFISEYYGSEKPVKCLCHKCNTIWTTNRPIDLFRRNIGCPVCANESRKKAKAKSQEQFEYELNKVNKNIKIIGTYKGTHKPIKCKCEIDGYEWESYASNLLNGSAGCPLCNMSIGENNVITFFTKLGINFDTQKTFKDCKDIGLLKFDVYDNDNNIAIEFQGEQHYFPIDFSGKGKDNAIKEYNLLQKRDNIKKEYCLNNNLKLVCIPYRERNNVDNYLLEEVKIYKEKYVT